MKTNSRWETLARTHLNRDPEEYDIEFTLTVRCQNRTHVVPISREDFKEIRALVGGNFESLSDAEMRALLDSLSFRINDYLHIYARHKASVIHEEITKKQETKKTQETEKSETKAKSTEAKSKERNEKCELCGAKVSKKVTKYCRDHAEDFDGKILCFNCQKTYKANKEPLPNDEDEVEVIRVG